MPHPRPDDDLGWLAEALRRPPGEDAQYRMAPALRWEHVRASAPPASARPSAVLILLYPAAAGWSTLLIKRGTYDGAHSGQVAFPGGRLEPHDASEAHAALREAEEEVGLDPAEVDLLGRLSPLYVPASHHLIHPFVGRAAAEPLFRPEPAEVSALLPVDLAHLFAPGTKAETTLTVRGGLRLQAPYYAVAGETVWGATAMIISELEAVFGRERR
jgi:8-oxo-dGTP pyrophosphatase MutT (NUDIX family)